MSGWSIPDAPWIRDPETYREIYYGYPVYEEPGEDPDEEPEEDGD